MHSWQSASIFISCSLILCLMATGCAMQSKGEATTSEFAQQAGPFGGFDQQLLNEIASWKEGNPPPRKLLQFPFGPPEFPPICGMRAPGSAVEDYIARINDDELLKALLFDIHADTDCVRWVCYRLIELRGVKAVRDMLADRRKSHPADFQQKELATLVQLLASPYARIRVASLNKKDVSKDAGEKVLEGLRADLSAGIAWGTAYGKASDLLPDEARTRKEGHRITLLCYQYDGLVSPTGFDLWTRFICDRLDPEHIRKLFEVKDHVQRHETATTYWIYFVEAVYGH